MLSNLFPFSPLEPEGSAREEYNNCNTLRSRKRERGSHPRVSPFLSLVAVQGAPQRERELMHRRGACWVYPGAGSCTLGERLLYSPTHPGGMVGCTLPSFSHQRESCLSCMLLPSTGELFVLHASLSHTWEGCMCCMSPLHIPGRAVCAACRYHTHGEGRHVCASLYLSHGRMGWSMRLTVLFHGRIGWSMRLIISPLREKRLLYAQHASLTLRRIASSMRNMPLSSRRIASSMRRGLSS